MIHLYRNLKENGDLYDLISACPEIARNHSNMLVPNPDPEAPKVAM